MILGRNYRFSVNNQAGATLTSVVINARRFKFDSSGARDDESAEATVYNQSTITVSTTAWRTGATQDNSATKWLGGDFEITVTPSGSATGSVVVQIEHSTDGGTDWPSGGGGARVVAFAFNASSAAQTKTVRIE